MNKTFLFNQALPLVEIGRHRPIQEEDLIDLPAEFNVELIRNDLAGFQKKSVLLFLWQVINKYKSKMILSLVLLLLASSFSLSSPVILHKFILVLKSGATTPDAFYFAIFLCVCLGITSILAGFLQQHALNQVLPIEIKVNADITSSIFDKILKLHSRSRMKYQSGEIVSLVASDSLSISDICFLTIDSINILFLLSVCCIQLWLLVGWASLAAIAMFVLFIPFTRLIVKAIQKADDQMLAAKDQRMSLLSQVIAGIRVVKYFGWTGSVLAQIQQIRNRELAERKKLISHEVLLAAGYLSFSSLVLILTLGTYSFFGGTLTLELVIASSLLISLMRGPLDMIGHHLAIFSYCRVSSARIIDFLQQEECNECTSTRLKQGEPIAVNLSDVSVSFVADLKKSPTKVIQEKQILFDVSLSIASGTNVAIVGEVGCGKSVLLQTILGEWEASSGTVEFLNSLGQGVRPALAYVPQTAFITNSTIRENIVFGSSRALSDIDIAEALNVSQLRHDLLRIPKGLEAEIGEMGVNLSGGQKQRLALARAYLADADVVILDDPLSAVDAKTEEALCRDLIFGRWAEKTVIVVTHRLEHLPQFDKVVFMQDGRIVDQGTFYELYARSSLFRDFYQHHDSSQKNSNAVGNAAPVFAKNHNLANGIETFKSLDSTTDADVSNFHQANGRITIDEERKLGKTSLQNYVDYIRDLVENGKTSVLVFIGLITAVLTNAFLPAAENYWLSTIGSEIEFQKTFTRWATQLGFQTVANNSFLWIDAGIVFLIGVCFIVTKRFWFARGSRVGAKIHDRMLHSILNSPLRFFDSTPAGRILQRFARDLLTVDLFLQFEVSHLIATLSSGFVSLCMMLFVAPISAVFLLPAGYLFYRLQRDYRSPAREVKRIESITRSPVIAFVNEAAGGLQVIRSFGAQESFRQEFRNRVLRSLKSSKNGLNLNRWFSGRVPFLGGFIVAFSGISLTVLCQQESISPAMASLAMVYSLSIWNYFNLGLRAFTEVEARMTSFERLKHYVDLPIEKDILGEPIPLRSSWPERGEIEFQNVQARYANHLPLILKDLSFHVKGGSRVGIVGRTGSGKSTLTQVLFRFINPQGGTVLIDGVDITKVPLDRLRQSIAIIPQDPTLFMGTLRSNLDRENKYDDAALENVLRRVSLWEFVHSLPDGLLSQVTENGQNLSQGQRQLFCLARAMLSNAKILVLDEATASVDVQTDEAIQEIVRNYFPNSTVLIIAHRLSTIEDADLILQIQDGVLKKSGTFAEVFEKRLNEHNVLSPLHIS